MPIVPFSPQTATDPSTSGTGGLMPGIGPVPSSSSVPSADSLDSLATEYPTQIAHIGQQTSSESEALNMLKNLAEHDPAYYELYIKLLAERENNEWAWNRYEEFNKNYYQRSVEDLKAAGLNPYLALTNGIGQAGTGSISRAGTFDSGVYQAKSSEKIAENKNLNDSILKGVTVLGTILAAMIWAMA